jgi:hypothetical protein
MICYTLLYARPANPDKFVFFMQMTITATLHAEEKDLIDLGISKKGDIISLRAFCTEKMNAQNTTEKMNEKKVLLEQILVRNKHKRKKDKEANSSVNGKQARTSTKRYSLVGYTMTTSKGVWWLYANQGVVVQEMFLFLLMPPWI